MGEFTWEGWQNSVEGAATPTGLVIKRDGEKLTVLVRRLHLLKTADKLPSEGLSAVLGQRRRRPVRD